MSAIPPDIERAIQAELDSVVREHAVRILWACESGSRAWGFPSPDSDFDVRFIYIHERDWYLSIAPGRDVIERPVDEVLDVSGWDLRKALGLLQRGNVTLAEWIDSPIMYRETPGFRDEFVSLIDRAYRPDRAHMHYRTASERQQALATAGGEVKVKKFLYALRTCLAAEWAATRDEKPPMRLDALVAGCGLDAATMARIDELVAMKAGLAERSDAAVDPDVVGWLAVRIARLASLDVEPVAAAPMEWFDSFFRQYAT
jgi:predicted nucleotidyltransferase